MKLTHIEHLGIAVKSLDEAIPFYENTLGLKCYAIEEVAEQKVRTAFFKVGQTKIELLEATDPESAIAKFIDKKGEGIQHVAFAVEGLQENLDELAAKGVRLIDAQPRKGAELKAAESTGGTPSPPYPLRPAPSAVFTDNIQHKSL